eukprot:1157834-Pelagomonas_calceolata.AAC.22
MHGVAEPTQQHLHAAHEAKAAVSGAWCSQATCMHRMEPESWQAAQKMILRQATLPARSGPSVVLSVAWLSTAEAQHMQGKNRAAVAASGTQ